MKADEVRRTFLDFFASREHREVRSASLVPANDPTLLFTNAGMVQFKDLFTGRETRDYKRAATSQKCVRAGGKHNDLDEVGKTARHHTFFEMLGNFSFGDYFKHDAVTWAWELLTEVMGLAPEKLVVTVHRGDEELGLGPDEEAQKIWADVTGFGRDRILRLPTKENFWMMGETGPMGPCSEIHYYMGEGPPRALPEDDSPESAWGDWLEIWNLVFMQYERREVGGTLHPLPAPSIDTGAGLERLTSVLQGVQSNYDTDLFAPLIRAAADAAGVRYGEDPGRDTSMRVIADHARATSFLVADGVFPDKNGREYVLRRIFRRAVRHGKLLGIEEPFMHRICAVVVEEMKDAFPELSERASVIHEITLEEEKRFRATLDRGLSMLEEEFSAIEGQSKTISGSKVFQLYDTYGFPEDLTEIIAGEHGFSIDRAGYEAELERARERSRFSGSGDGAVQNVYKELAEKAGDVEFTGYEGAGIEGSGKVVALAAGDTIVERAEKGADVAFVCDRTPFYGESGGQIGDTGVARGSEVEIDIIDCIKPDGQTIIHLGKLESGTLSVGDLVTLEVTSERRNRIRANHSATHLLHLALKKTLGQHVAQKGSLVAPDRLRFDFAHFSPMSEEQLSSVEDWVNRQVLRNSESITEVLPVEEAKTRGAVAMFGEKYGESVRIVQIGDESLEFCGGTHVARSGDIGLFKITSEAGVAQGVRRIEAVTGIGALEYLRHVESTLREASTKLKTSPQQISERIDRMQAEQKSLEKEVAQLKQKLASGGSRDLMSEATEIDGIKVLATSTEVDDAKALRETGDHLRDRIGSGIVVLAGIGADKVSLLAMVSKDLTARVHAGKLLGAVAEVVGGRGGGRPDMAQGGGKDASKVPQALERALDFVREALA